MGTLIGASAIAEALGLQVRQVRHLVATGALPHYRIGNKICSSHGLLDHWQAGNDARAIAAFQAKAETASAVK